MRIAASTILACSFTLINAERAETGEEVPLMQATHLSEVSLEAEAGHDDGVSEDFRLAGGGPAATRHSAPRQLQRQRQHQPLAFVEELDHRRALYAKQVANARMLLEDKDLALSPEQQDVIKAMHSPNHVRFGLLLSEDSESTLRCCTADEFESMKKVSKRRPMYYIQSLLEDKDLGLTQEQREILLEDQTREQDAWTNAWNMHRGKPCGTGRDCWPSLKIPPRRMAVPVTPRPTPRPDTPTDTSSEKAADASATPLARGSSDAKDNGPPGWNTGGTASDYANGFDNNDHTRADDNNDEKVPDKGGGI